MALVRSTIGAVKTLITFDIRNGTIEQAKSLITKPAIADMYKWVPIADLPPELAISHIDLFIRSALVKLNAGLGANVTDADKRKQAIILGTARAVITELYRLTPTDLIPGETVTAMYVYTPPVGDAAAGTIAVAPEQTDAVVAVLNADMNFTEAEHGVMSELLMCSVGLPAIQGASLMACGHHYLSEAGEKSRPLYEVIEKQFWKKGGLKTFLEGIEDTARDLLWHKAGHPVNLSLKLKCAVDPAIAEKIRLTGSGSSASRLPAKESNLKAAETALTLCTNVRPFYECYKGSMDCSILHDAVNLASVFLPASLITADNNGGLPGMDPKDWKNAHTPAWVVDRATALRYVDDIMKNNLDQIAMAFGFFEALAESAAMGSTGTAEQTLLNAYSLQKLRNQMAASYYLGREAYGDYKAYKANERTGGKYQPVKAMLR